MAGLNATQLAARMELSKGRISQLVADGTFSEASGCFTGHGRARRFNFEICASAYRGLDPGQRLGNGAKTQAAIRDAVPIASADTLTARPPAQKTPPNGDDALYQASRAIKAAEDARRARRDNEADEGNYVLASEVEKQVKKLIGQEIAEFEGLLKDVARRFADEHGVDFMETRAMVLQMWRDHRGNRTGRIAAEAEAASLSEDEEVADI